MLLLEQKKWVIEPRSEIVMEAFMLQWGLFSRVNSDGFSSSVTVLQKSEKYGSEALFILNVDVSKSRLK